MAAAIAKSRRLKRHRRRQPSLSKQRPAISSSRAEIAASGIRPSTGAIAATSRSSQPEANTAAIGVRAPASRFGIERLSEPQDTYDEKNAPTRFDRPWPRNSRFASMRWPERSATALAIEIDCASVTMVRAKAMPIRSGSRAGSNVGQ